MKLKGFAMSLNYGQQQEGIVRKWLLSQDTVSHCEYTTNNNSNRQDILRQQHIFGDLRVTTSFGDVHYIEVKTDRSAVKTGNLFLETYSDDGTRTGNVRQSWMLRREKHCKITHYIFNLIGRSSVIVRKRDLEDYFDEHYNTGKYKEVSMNYDQEQANRSKGVLIPIPHLLTSIKSCNTIEIPNGKRVSAY